VILETQAVAVSNSAADVVRLGCRLERMHGGETLSGKALEHGRIEPEMRADVDERAAAAVAVREREQRRQRLGLVLRDALAREPALQPGLLAVQNVEVVPLGATLRRR